MMTDPFAALATRPDGALALLIRAEGGFPRRPGAVMALWPDGARVGRLGAGCIDADIAAHLEHSGPVTRLIYGAGGPVDLPLPCGGTVEIALIRHPDADWLKAIAQARRDRTRRGWRVDLATGHAHGDDRRRAGLSDDGFVLDLPPPCALHVHGEGDEATALAAMARGLDLPCHLGPETPPPDAQTAVVTLFHDHDRELPALRSALLSPAFYVGALGSRRAQLARLAALREAGLTEAQIVRLHGPIGVVAPVREPKLLAASVLTEILAAYQTEFG
ncbi:XdhC family protein [Paracoccus salsus]|uniref:XdhC family protein n=1 Tax=Paracoccus salsus TaxID=2911061 RepID=UPI001F2F1ACB|nr:XdhC family protein [Paracoccus salsus]MCF3973518.1 XdhC family protein [Paracoccus salsus]